MIGIDHMPQLIQRAVANVSKKDKALLDTGLVSFVGKGILQVYCLICFTQFIKRILILTTKFQVALIVFRCEAGISCIPAYGWLALKWNHS